MQSLFLRSLYSYSLYKKYEKNHMNKREEVIGALVAYWREKLHPAGESKVGYLPTEDIETALY